MDTQLYLDRIHYKGPVSVSKEVLFGLQVAHLRNVPFENLDIHYKTKILLDIPSIYQKVVLNLRGGFCYELNGLFCHLLKSIGFDVHMISARVHSKNDNYGEEFDHMAIVAKVEGKQYLVDVGFGKFSYSPLEIVTAVDQRDKFGVFRFDKAHGDYMRVNSVVNGILLPQYLFEVKERELKEFEGMCEFHQTSKESHFTNKKVVSIINQNGRLTLNNNQIKITEGESERITEFEEELFEAKLKEYFDIELKYQR